MEKNAEQRHQESLKRISSAEIEEPTQQLKPVKLACTDAKSNCTGISDPKENTKPTKEVLESKGSPQDATHATQLLHSCEEQRTFCEGIYNALIKLVGEVGQPRDDNFMCIKQLCDFTKQLKDQEKMFLPKIELLHNLKQNLDQLQIAQVKDLEKWSRAQKEQFEGVDRLLSTLLNEEKNQRLSKRGSSETVMCINTPLGFRRKIGKAGDSTKSSNIKRKSHSFSKIADVKKKSNISGPLYVQRMCFMDTDKKLTIKKAMHSQDPGSEGHHMYSAASSAGSSSSSGILLNSEPEILQYESVEAENGEEPILPSREEILRQPVKRSKERRGSKGSKAPTSTASRTGSSSSGISLSSEPEILQYEFIEEADNEKPKHLSRDEILRQPVKRSKAMHSHDPGSEGHHMYSVVPLEINLRGRPALEAYKKALTEGRACVKRVPVMLIGQDHSGKTSLKNSLMGKPFNPDEDSTVGIDVDPSYFKVSSEIWKAGERTENNQATNDVEALSFEHHAARLVAKDLKEEMRDTKSMRPKNIESNKESSLDVSSSSSSNTAELPVDMRKSETFSKTSRDAAESIHTSKDRKVDVRKHVQETSSDPTQRREEHSPLALPKIPNEVETLVTKLLQEVEKVQDEEDIYSVLWDFGGQFVYYATHPLFITAKAMYLLVYDLSQDPYDKAESVVKQGMYKKILDNQGAKTNLDYLYSWMASIASLASQDEHQHVRSGLRSEVLRSELNIPPVFLVCTHADEPYDGRADPFVLARELFCSLQTKPYKNHLHEDVFVVDNTKSGHKSECSEVKRLREKVLAVAQDLPQMKEVIPIKWLKYEKTLQVTAKEGHKWISLEMAKHIASEVCNINDDQEFATLLNFLHDQRILIHFDDTPVLNNLVVLDIQWLVDVFKRVITVKPSYDQEEIVFKDLWFRLQSTGILDEKLLEHQWGPLLDNRDTAVSLLEIMEKFSLLCPWPSNVASCDKQYLVPSMLMSHPPQDIIELFASAQIPSLFLKFESGHVPQGLFPRLVLQYFQWGKNEFWSSENPQLYHNFVRFYTSGDEDCSVILLCHFSSIEVVVHRGNLSSNLTDSFQSKLNISVDIHYDAFEVACARAVRRHLGLMLECMRKEFCWLRNMKYEVGVMCPVCCQGRLLKYCCTHHKQGCEQEECLHFWSESDLRSNKQFLRCRKCATAKFNKVHVKQIAPWIETPGEQLTIVERDKRLLAPEEENDEKLPALPSKDFESLLSQQCDPKEVVLQIKDCLQLDQSTLEQPDPWTKRLIRCLATKAKQSDRLDVFDHLREITPAGTTGPRLPDGLDIQQIPFRRMRALTVRLSGGDEWKIVAEELGLNADEIRYLDNRTQNPCEALLAYIAQHCYRSVGYLYNILNKCEFPLVADIL